MADGQVKIDTIFAFIALDPEDNTEGIIALASPMGPLPMVGADLPRVEALRPHAERSAKQLGVKVTLAHFTNRTDIETFGGDDAAD